MSLIIGQKYKNISDKHKLLYKTGAQSNSSLPEDKVIISEITKEIYSLNYTLNHSLKPKSYLVQCTSNNHYYNQRVFDLSSLTRKDKNNFPFKYDKINTLRHPCIYSPFSYIDKGNSFSITTSYLPQESLTLYFKHKRVTKSICHMILLKVLDALEFFHSNDMIMHNISPETILIETKEHKQIYITDLYLITMKRNDSEMIKDINDFCSLMIFLFESWEFGDNQKDEMDFGVLIKTIKKNASHLTIQDIKSLPWFGYNDSNKKPNPQSSAFLKINHAVFKFTQLKRESNVQNKQNRNRIMPLPGNDKKESRLQDYKRWDSPIKLKLYDNHPMIEKYDNFKLPKTLNSCNSVKGLSDIVSNGNNLNDSPLKRDKTINNDDDEKKESSDSLVKRNSSDLSLDDKREEAEENNQMTYHLNKMNNVRIKHQHHHSAFNQPIQNDLKSSPIRISKDKLNVTSISNGNNHKGLKKYVITKGGGENDQSKPNSLIYNGKDFDFAKDIIESSALDILEKALVSEKKVLIKKPFIKNDVWGQFLSWFK